jgi:FtsP/CotA-like multicopper oxidase with cupredoxin domain
MTSLAPGAAAATPTTQPTVTYTFTAGRAGTYLYEAGTDPETQVRMGLFGALIVRPVDDTGAAHDDHAYDSADSAFDPKEEFMVLLSEIDPYQHQAVERGKTFNITKYKARYWLINGRGYPDSIADNGASWLPNQPYGSLATVQPYDPVKHPLSGMARYLSVGSEDYPFHPHGNNGLVIGRDGHELKNGSADMSMEKFAINIGPGQTWDVLFKWYDAEDYSPTNPVTVTVPSLANQVVGTFYSGSPYLGSTQALPPGVQTLNQCGEYYIISHNHALYQITSWGVTMTGPITYMRIEPPTPNTCG